MERRLATILAADIVGYSRLIGEAEEDTLVRLRDLRTTIEELVVLHHGTLFSVVGDSAVAEFTSPVQAVRCALEIQLAVTRQNAGLPDKQWMQLRIGLHLGDVAVVDNAPLGDGVNIAARVEHLAPPGGILVSDDVYRQVRRKVIADFEDLGERRLRNIASPIRIYDVHSGRRPWFIRAVKRLQHTSHKHLVVFILLIIAGTSVSLWYGGFGVPDGLISKLSDKENDQPSIAVLPLKNMSGDDDYYSDGLTQDITGELSRFQNLFVVASHSAFVYKGRPARVEDIGRDLRVRYLLDGTFQRADGRVRMTAQLIDARTGRQIWSDRYDALGQNIFKIQDDLIQMVVARLAVNVDAAERSRVMSNATSSADAYEHYLKGREAFELYTREGNAKAQQEFAKALELDPGFARALSWQAYAILEDYKEGWTDQPDQASQQALEMATRAVELAPGDYYTQWTLATLHVERGEDQQALDAYERASQLNQNDPDMLASMADMLSFHGDPKRAVAQIQRAMELNPHFPNWYWWSLGFAFFQDRQYTEAVEALERLDDPPNEALLLLAISLKKVGRPIPKDELLKKLQSKDPNWTPAHLDRMPFANPEDQKHWLDGLKEVGIPD